MIDTDKRLRLTEWLSTPCEELKFDLQAADDSILPIIFEFLQKPDQNLELFKTILKKFYQIYQCGTNGSGHDKHRLLVVSFLPLLCGLYLRHVHQHSSKSFSQLHHHNSGSMSNAFAMSTKSSVGSISSLGSPSKQHESQSQHPQSILSLTSSEMNALSILLLYIYNFEVIDTTADSASNGGGKLKTTKIRVVTLAKPSIYHETNANILGLMPPPPPITLTTGAGTPLPNASVAGTIKPLDNEISIFGPHPEREHLNMANYQQVFSVLFEVYNHHIGEVGLYSHAALCHYYLGLMRQGQVGGVREVASLRTNIRRYLAMDEVDDEAEEARMLGTIMPKVMRIQWSADLLVQLTRSVHFCYFNHQETISGELLNEICNYATHKLQSNVLLMVNAFKNSLCINNRKQASAIDQEMADMLADVNLKNDEMNGSAFAGQPLGSGKAQWRSSYKKIALTNASFKARKLPEDIPIVPDPNASGADSPGVDSNNKRTPPLVRQIRSGSQSQRMESIDEEAKESVEGSATKSGKKTRKHRNSKEDKEDSGGAKGEGPTKKMKNLFKEFKDKRTSSKEHTVQSPPPTGVTNGKVQNGRKSSGDKSCNETNESGNEEMIPMKTFNNNSNSTLRFAKFDEEEEDVKRGELDADELDGSNDVDSPLLSGTAAGGFEDKPPKVSELR